MTNIKTPSELNDLQRTTLLPAATIAAAKKLIAALLESDEGDLSEAESFLKKGLGRQKSKSPTFGDIEKLAQIAIVDRIIERLDLDVGVTTSGDLTTALTFIHPDISICSEADCGMFPIAELGSVWTIRTKGNCPWCKRGLITEVKRQGPYRNPLTGKQVPYLQTVDGNVSPGQELPIRGDIILEWSQSQEPRKRWFSIDLNIMAALNEESLTEEQLDGSTITGIRHLIDYLVHEKNAEPTRVYGDLADATRLGLYEYTAVRQLVRDAKAWNPNSETTSEPTSSSSTGDQMRHFGALNTLLGKLFTAQELVMNILWSLEGGFKVANPINTNGGAGDDVLIPKATRSIIQSKFANKAFFDKLRKEREFRSDEINEVERLFLG